MLFGNNLLAQGKLCKTKEIKIKKSWTTVEKDNISELFSVLMHVYEEKSACSVGYLEKKTRGNKGESTDVMVCAHEYLNMRCWEEKSIIWKDVEAIQSRNENNTMT